MPMRERQKIQKMLHAMKVVRRRTSDVSNNGDGYIGGTFLKSEFRLQMPEIRNFDPTIDF